MYNSKRALGCAMLAVLASAYAEAALVTVTSDTDDGRSELHSRVDGDGNLAGIRYLDFRGDGSLEEERSYDIGQVRAGVALVVKTAGPFSRDVIRLTAPNLGSNGGSGWVTVLREYGYFSNDYRRLDIELERHVESWELVKNTRAGRAGVDSIHFMARRDGDSVVGIESMRLSRSGQTVEAMSTAELPE